MCHYEGWEVKTIEQAGRLEIQIRADVVLSMKSERQASMLETQAGFLCCDLEAEFFEKPVFALKAFN